MPARAFLIGLPVLFIALTLWSAQQAQLNRELRRNDLFALVSEAGLPSVNPYLPGSEAARQLATLVHAPLFKLDAQGQIAPALASEWRWMKRVTVWLETESAAQEAVGFLEALKPSRWASWKLASITRDQTQVSLLFSATHDASIREVLQTAKARVLPVTVLRLTVPGNGAALRKALLDHPELAQPVSRTWWDGQDALELALTPMPLDYEQRLRTKWPAIPLQVEVLARQPVLEEPLLEVMLHDGARWHDRTHVSASDVKATFEALRDTDWPLPNRAGLLAAHRIEVIAPSRLRIALWRQHGPALNAWVGLPILPSSWWKDHPPDAAGKAFHQFPPPGAGPCAVVHRGPGLLVLEPVSASNKATRLSLIASLSGFNASLGFATHALDLCWPATPAALPSAPTSAMTRCPSPPRDLIQVCWNTRNDLLTDSRVRQALAAGVDRGALVQKALAGQARPHGSFFARNLWLSAQPRPEPRAPDRAESLLAEAGWLRNVQGIATRPDRPLAFQLTVPENDPALLRVAAELRLQWLAIGAEVRLRLLAPEALKKALATRDFDAVLTRSTPLATWDLGAEWHTRGARNMTGFSNRRLDLLIEALMQCFDPALATKEAREAEALILGSHAVLPLLLTHETASLRAGLSAEDTSEGWTLGNLLLR